MASVLIIDDYQGTLDTYSTILRIAGFETATASTGRAGIALAKSRPFDVTLVDLQLPDISGIDVVSELKHSVSGGRVVIVTAFPTVDTSFDAACAGAAGYVDGALFGDEVVQVVGQALGGQLPVRHPRVLPCFRNSAVTTGQPNAIQRLDRRVIEVMRLINGELSQPTAMKQMAARVGLGPSGLRHLFRAQTGISMAGHRLERRLDHVARRLRTSFEHVGQIAHEAGYSAAALTHFRRAFRARYGMSPTRYRSQLLGEASGTRGNEKQ